MKEKVSTIQYCYSDAWEWGWGYWTERKYVLDRYYVHCLVTTTILILLDPELFKAQLGTAYRLCSDPRFRKEYGYVYTCVPLARYERDFIQDYCTRHRIPIKVALTAGYVLLKNIARYNYNPENVPEEIIVALRELKCIEAIEILLHYIPRSIYNKYFINYVPGLKKLQSKKSCS